MADAPSIFEDEIQSLGTDRRKRCLAPPTEPITRGGRYFHRVLGLDLRSLALFRVLISAVLLFDLAERARHLVAHYTDAGIMPRDDAVRLAPSAWTWSLHLVSGQWPLQALLFAIAAAAALMLLVGWRTRFATIVSWLLLASLHGRNHLVLQGGDVLLRCLLFWSMFLPLGASWSFDRARREDDWPVPRSVLSMGTAAFVIQLGMMYVCSGFLKNDAVWRDGSAGFYAMSIDQLATPFGRWMLGHPDLLRASTLFILWFERLAPIMLLVVSMAGVRVLAVGVFMVAHLAMFLCLELGPFPFICWAAWCALLPTAFWDRVLARWRKRPQPRIWFDGECGACWAGTRVLLTMLLAPGARADQAQDDPQVLAEMRLRESWLVDTPDGKRHHGFAGLIALVRWSPLAWPLAPLLRPFAPLGERCYHWLALHRREVTPFVRFLRPEPLAICGRSRAAAIACGYCLLLAALWNARTLAWSADDGPRAEPPLVERLLPRGCNWLVEIPRLDQHWNMFAPRPLVEDGWYEITATLADGTVVDLLRGGAPPAGKPERVADLYDGERWRKFLMNLATPPHRAAREPFARWLRARWDAAHPADQRVAALDMVFWVEPTTLVGDPPLRHERLYSWRADGRVAAR